MSLFTVIQIVSVLSVVVLLINLARAMMPDQYTTGILLDNLGNALGLHSNDFDMFVSAVGCAALGGYLAVGNKVVHDALKTAKVVAE